MRPIMRLIMRLITPQQAAGLTAGMRGPRMPSGPSRRGPHNAGMDLVLERLTQEQLRVLEAGDWPEGWLDRVEPGALPPERVHVRALALLAQGCDACWATSRMMCRPSDGRYLGNISFKGAPCEGRVEIGYQVAPGQQGQGLATAAVRLMLEEAWAAGVQVVRAEVLPENLPSQRVLTKAGFRLVGHHADARQEWVGVWEAVRPD